MNPICRSSLAPGLALALILAACGADASPKPSVAQPTATQTPDPTASVSPGAEADASVSPSAEASQSPTSFQPPGGFTVATNSEADALFIDRDDCQNLDDGYRLQFPGAWFTNAEAGSLPPCSWFGPTAFEVDDPGDAPDEVAIEIFVINGGRDHDSKPMSREEVVVGVTQDAVRTEVAEDDGTMYEYVVQLGPTPEEGPNLVARTDTNMGGDYELNKAVLDRIMATIEFIGTIQ